MASKTNRSEKHGDLPVREVRDATHKVDDRNEFRVVQEQRTEAEQALVDLCDGNQPWDLHESTGLSADRCDEIWIVYTKALNKRPFPSSKGGAMTTMTREQAIDALVERDVARWGEGERGASRRAHAGRTLGRALNALSYDSHTDTIDETIAAQAQAVMTEADRACEGVWWAR